MSKRPDTNDEPNTETGRRRRRRRGGLRVPSDNVPRRNADGGEGEEVGAPAPEDPRLAVSVAYAFSADGSQPNEESPAPEEEQPTTPIPEESAPGPAAGDESQPYATFDVAGDREEGGSSVEAAAAAPGGSADEPGERDSSEASAAASAPAEDDSEEEEEETVELARASTGPGVSLNALAERDDSTADGDSVDIAFDEDDSEEGPAARRPNRAATIALGDQDLEELLEDDDEPTQISRAPEEPSEAAPPPPPPSAEEGAPSTGEDAAVDAELDARKTMQVPVVPPPQPQADGGESPREGVEAEGQGEGEAKFGRRKIPTVVTRLEERLQEKAQEQEQEQGERPEPMESGDSGEIIADDMIEEIREGGAAAPATKGGEEIDPNSTMELSGEEEEVEEVEEGAGGGVERAEAKEPPPPPATSTAPPASPPPAPSSNAQQRAAAVAAVGQPQAKARRRKGKPWFEEIFDEDYLRTLPFLTPQATQAEANFVMDSLGVEPGGHILDVGCGYGRHAMELAARGYHVVGLDSSLPLLLRGADEAQRRGLTINFVHGDMREMSFESQFDGAYCLFNTFGYFDDETNKKTAQNIARALKPGARLVVDVLNRDYLLSDLPARVWWEGDGCVVLEEVEFNYFSSRIVSNRSVVFDDGRQLEQEISIRSFSLHELGKLLHAAGFRVVEISGSMATRGRFFGAQSRDIVAVTERREKKDDK